MFLRWISIGAFAFVVLVHRSEAQSATRPWTEARPASLPTVLEGRVFESNGAPAVGAVVVTSAGGRAVTGLDGRYRLEIRVPLEVESVQVTAVSDDGGTASAAVDPFAAQRITVVGPLVLALGMGCQPRWLPTFGKDPGVNGPTFTLFGVTSKPTIQAMAVFDAGGGPALFAGGFFSAAGGQLTSLARWDGSSWAPVTSSDVATIHALAVFDDGSGPAMYAGGPFSFVNGVPANSVAKWDGSNWAPLGSGTNLSVNALAVFDDGNGPALYAGGEFTSAGGAPANAIARWDGATWSSLGSGLGGTVNALLTLDDGDGPALYAAGSFTSAGATPANRIAKWDGSSWSALGTGLGGTVNALALFDGVGGPALFVGGEFTSAGGAPANHIAKWDGSSWSALGTGMNGPVNALAIFDDGSGPALYSGSKGGPHYVARWNGAGWSPLDGGMDDWVQSFAVFDAGDGPALYAGGKFKIAGGVPVSGFARWSEGGWSALERGLNAPVRTLAVCDDGGGPALYVGGEFTGADGVLARGITRWDGTSWSPLGLGLGNDPPDEFLVTSMAVFDDGSGPGLYVGGRFDTAGGVAVNGFARWDGSSWSGVGNGPGIVTNAMVVFDDGNGPALYAGGSSFGGAINIRKWNGANWSGLAGGDVSGAPYPDTAGVYALTVFDDGNGPALYVGGEFESAGGVGANGIARWDGASWSALGTGLMSGFSFPLTLAVFDDGDGPALYAGGSFQSVVRWDGSSWSALGSGMSGGTFPYVHALTVFDDGSGSALYAGGNFTVAGGVAANGVARWDGSSWSALGGGVSDSISFDFQQRKVAALCVFPGLNGRELVVGGSFAHALDSGDSFLAKWRGCFEVRAGKVRRR
jgi:hypothetical protein